jgi:hypothetical protein
MCGVWGNVTDRGRGNGVNVRYVRQVDRERGGEWFKCAVCETM